MSSPAEKALQLVKYLPRVGLNNLVKNPYEKKVVNKLTIAPGSVNICSIFINNICRLFTLPRISMSEVSIDRLK